MRRRLRDDPSDNEHTTPLSGSLEVLDSYLDLEASRPYTKAAVKVRETWAQVASPSQSKEEGSDMSSKP